MNAPSGGSEERVAAADDLAEAVEDGEEAAASSDRRSYEPMPEQRVHILLTEYHEAIETLRNWDKIVFQMLSIVGSVAAAIVAFMAQGGSPLAWGAVFSLILFWLFSYLWQVRVANQRIVAIMAIEDELNMVGQYRQVEKLKNRKTVFIWMILPYIGAFVLGPLIGYLVAHGDKLAQLFGASSP